MRVSIDGCGAAGATLARLLAIRGFEVIVRPAQTAMARQVLVPLTTWELLRDLFGSEQMGLLPGRLLESRHVAWSARASEQVESTGLLCDLRALESILTDELRRTPGIRLREAADLDPDTDWAFEARGRRAAPDCLQAGRRVALEACASGALAVPRDGVVVACVESGWLFAAPQVGEGASLALVVPIDGKPIDAAAVLEAAISELWPTATGAVLSGPVRISSCAPFFSTGCAAQARMQIGDAALALDPLRGDGVGYGVRGALLAAAVLGAIVEGADAGACLRHFQTRLANVFRSHLESCLGVYARAWNASIWCSDMDDTVQTLRELGPSGPTAYALAGFDLVSTTGF